MKLLRTKSRVDLLFAGLVGSLLLAAATPAIAASGNTAVSDDGTETVAPNYAASSRGVSSFEGLGTPRAGAAESKEELERLLRAKPMTAPSGVESIIGADNRFLINPTTSFPARAVVLITFDPPGPGTSRCTGWLIGPRTVITAGHCLAARASGVFYPRTTYRIYPGRNGAASPFGVCTAASLHTVSGWIGAGGNEQFDYGAINLNCTIGNTTGWFGWWWQAASLTGLLTRVSGYPGDKPLTQWQSIDRVRVTQTNQIFYQNDTVGGNSGGPVWQNRGSTAAFCQGACGMAIHAYGLHGAAPQSTNNHGTRITQARHNNFCSWRAPTPC
jgi:glutamyl endopeptidase